MAIVSSCYQWYVCYTRCNHEIAAMKSLQSIGIEVFLPLQRVLRMRTDRMIRILQPVFRSYIFVRVSIREYQLVLQTKSISRYVAICGKPCVVPEEQIQAIQTIFSNSVDCVVTRERFRPGQQVIITSGALSGYSAEVVDQKGKNFLLLRIGDLDQTLLITTPFDYVLAANH